MGNGRDSVLGLFLLHHIVSSAVLARSQCDASVVFRDVARCDHEWGFNLDIFQQNLPGHVFDIDKLIDYCRQPNRKDIYRCIRTAYGACDPDWRVDILRRGRQDGGLGRRAFGYLCSNTDAIDENRECIQGRIWEISACFRIGAEDFIGLIAENRGSRGRGNKWSRNRGNIRQMSEKIERCVQQQLSKACAAPVPTILGNFLYGTLVYPYLDRNRISPALV